MKKTGILIFLAVVCGLAISCASSKKVAENKSDLKKVTPAPKTKLAKNADSPDVSKKEVIFSRGIVQIKAKPNLGSFNIGVINGDDKVVPVLSTANEYTSTNLQLKAGKKIYKLIFGANVTRTASKTRDGVLITYEIPKVAKVEARFDSMQSSDDSDVDMLKVVYEITNIGSKKDDFALKAIYDTVLGEITPNHFYTADNVPVKSEVMYRNMKNQKWAISKNNSAAVQFLFDGGDVTPPEIVALANYSTLSKNAWEPNMLTYRAFDTVLSYNNSCVGAIWKSETLKPNQSAKIIHYISLAADSNEPNGETFIYGISKNEDANDAAKEIIQKIPQIVDERANQKDENQNPQIIEIKIEEIVNEDKLNPSVEFNVNGNRREKYTPQYIQALLDRIDELEKNSASANREEILRLNEELDEILSALRQ